MLEVIYSKADGIKKALVKGKGWTPVDQIYGTDEVKCSKNKFDLDNPFEKKHVWRAWFMLPLIRDSVY